MDKKGLRRAEVFEAGQWSPIAFENIRVNSVFRLFDDMDDPIEHGQPCIALGNAFPDPDTKVYTIKCEELRDLIPKEKGKNAATAIAAIDLLISVRNSLLNDSPKRAAILASQIEFFLEGKNG